jgi:hypothetical protein
VTSVGRPTPFPRAVAYFRRHPIVLLLLLTPGIPEYLSGSTSVWTWVASPAGLLLGLFSLGLNLGLYGPGVLLVREAHVRWRKGWLGVLLLGAAYGLLEEGTALSTLFDPKSRVVASLGYYGHAYGVNWVWLIGVLGIHIVLSIGLPIVLLGLALPETRGRSLVGGRPLALVVAIFAIDLLLLNALVNYPAGHPQQLGALLVAGALWLVVWRLPAGALDPPARRPRRGPGAFVLYGVAYLPVVLIVPGLGEDFHLPAVVSGLLDLVVAGVLFLAVRRDVGRVGNEAQLTMLAVGAVVPLMIFGLIAQYFLPVVLVLDVVAGLFFYTLWVHYRPTAAPTVPAGALSG